VAKRVQRSHSLLDTARRASCACSANFRFLVKSNHKKLKKKQIKTITTTKYKTKYHNTQWKTINHFPSPILLGVTDPIFLNFVFVLPNHDLEFAILPAAAPLGGPSPSSSLIWSVRA